MNVASGTRATLIPDVQGSFIGALDASSGTLTKYGDQTYGESGTTGTSYSPPPCVYNSDCSSPLVCRSGGCVDECRTSVDCSAGVLCSCLCFCLCVAL